MSSGNEISVTLTNGETVSVAPSPSSAAQVSVANGGAVSVSITSVGDRGPKGDIGPPTALSIGSVSAGAVAAASLTGPAGDQVLSFVLPQGSPGVSVELGKNSTHVQWRPVGSASWIDLVPLTAITGANGANGANGAKGDKGDKGDSADLIGAVTSDADELLGESAVANIVSIGAEDYEALVTKRADTVYIVVAAIE
jgi:hypothetical protein